MGGFGFSQLEGIPGQSSGQGNKVNVVNECIYFMSSKSFSLLCSRTNHKINANQGALWKAGARKLPPISEPSPLLGHWIPSHKSPLDWDSQGEHHLVSQFTWNVEIPLKDTCPFPSGNIQHQPWLASMLCQGEKKTLRTWSWKTSHPHVLCKNSLCILLVPSYPFEHLAELRLNKHFLGHCSSHRGVLPLRSLPPLGFPTDEFIPAVEEVQHYQNFLVHCCCGSRSDALRPLWSLLLNRGGSAISQGNEHRKHPKC